MSSIRLTDRPAAAVAALPPSISTPATGASAVAKSGTKLWLIVLIACLAQFMVVLDASIVNVALPSMKTALGLSVTSQQWVVTGYLLAFGGLLLLAARLSDLFGRRLTFQVGLVVFTTASLIGGLAQDGTVLLIARMVQGVGAAALAPSSLSLITASHPDPDQRTKAMSWWGVAAAAAGATGVVLGGVLTAGVSWRWVFFVNVPVGVGLLIATGLYLVPSKPAGPRVRLDIPGAAAITLGITSLVYGVSAAPNDGWGSTTVLASLALAFISLATAVIIETRSAQPLIPAGIFKIPNVRTGNLLIIALGIMITAPLFFLSLYLQQVLGESALQAGLSLLPMAVMLSAGVIVSKRLIPKFGAKALLIAGAVVTAGGMVWLAQLPVHSDYLLHVMAPTLVAGAGMSVMLLPITVAATTGIDQRDSGVASGLINMGRQIGGALGLTVLVTVATSATRGQGGTSADALVHGYSTALLVVAGVSLAAAAIATLLKSAPRPTDH